MTTVDVAQGSRTQLLHKKQSGLGVPATGNYTITRINSFDLNPIVEPITPEELRSDREIYDYRHGNRNTAGNSVHDLSYGLHDTLLESMMFSTFSAPVTDDAGVIKIGTTPQYLSLEDGALDLGVYRPFYDMICSRGQFVFGTGREAIVRATFNWVGLSGGRPSVSSIGGTPVNPVANRIPFDTFSGSLFFNASESGQEAINITRMEMNIDNGAAPIFGLGQQEGIFVEFGRGNVTGSLSMYYTFDSQTALQNFLDETEAVIVMNIIDKTNHQMEFRLPRVKYSGGNVPMANEKSRIITLPFQAMKDNTVGSALKITKID